MSSLIFVTLAKSFILGAISMGRLNELIRSVLWRQLTIKSNN